MKINISYKNITPDEPLKAFVDEKIGGLEKFLGKGPVEANVEIGLPSRHHRTGPVFYAEINLKVGGRLMRSSSTHEDLRTAIVDAKNELQIQITKFKDKKKPVRGKSGKSE